MAGIWGSSSPSKAGTPTLTQARIARATRERKKERKRKEEWEARGSE